MQRFQLQGFPAGADEAAPGSIVEATNMIMARSGVAARRGPYTKLVSGIPNYPTAAVGQHGDGSLSAVWSDGTAEYVGDSTTSLALGINAANRVSNKYVRGIDDILNATEFTNGAGVMFPTFPAVGVNGTNIWYAGAPRSADITLNGEIDTSAAIGAVLNPSLGLNPGDSAAYRAVLAYDRTGIGDPVTVSGAPSGRFIYARTTSSTGVKCPILRIHLPSDFPLYYSTNCATPFVAYLYVYRSILSADANIALGAVDPAPTDEMQLIFKTIIASGDVSAGYIEFEEVCPQGAEGPALYTNPSLGGVNVERWLPPQANSIATYKGTNFYGGVMERIARTSVILTGTPYVFGTSIFTFAAGPSVKIPLPVSGVVPTIIAGMIFSVQGEGITATDYVVSGTATVSGTTLTIPLTGAPTSGSFANSQAVCGRVVVTCAAGSSTWNIDASINVATTGASGKFFTPRPVNTSTAVLEVGTKTFVQEFAAALCTGINLTCTGVSGVNITASNNASGTLEAATIELETRGSVATSGLDLTTTLVAQGTPTNYYDLANRIPTVKPSKLTAYLNRLMWSPNGIPDCVCPVNVLDIGSPQKEILRLVATRNALYIFKEDGLWVLDGDGSNWSLTFLSGDCIALSPACIDVFQDTVYAACTEGVIQISGGSLSAISGAIQQEYRDILLAQSPLSGNGAGDLTHTCIASHIDSSLTISIPVANSGSLPFSNRVSAVLVYSFITGEWLIGYQEEIKRYTSDSNVGTQSSATIQCRPAVRVQASNLLSGVSGDTTNDRIIRLLDPRGWPYLCAHAIETGGLVSSGTPGVITGSLNRTLPYTDDTDLVTIQADIGVGHFLSGPFAEPEYDWTKASLYDASNGLLRQVTAVTWTSDGTPEVRLLVTLATGSLGDFNPGTTWVLLPPPVSITFAPIGDGVAAYNFNECMIKQSRRSSAKNLQFSFWLDTTDPFPYTAPDVQTLGPLDVQVVSSKVTRAGVPARMTRGSCLNIRIQAGFQAAERVEFTTLLLDFAPTPGEEVGY